jgi:hypothetical protein
MDESDKSKGKQVVKYDIPETEETIDPQVCPHTCFYLHHTKEI